MLDHAYAAGALAAMGVVTLGLRALPFVAAQWLQHHPFVHRLSKFLPLAIMTLLLLHAVVGAAGEHAAGPWPELAAIALTMLLQWRSRNALLSILGGTALYVVLRNGGLF